MKHTNGEIPRILHQVWRDENIPPEFKPYCESWRRLNPGWEYRLWTDEKARAFVGENYPGFLALYEGYPHNIFRADALRPMLLGKLGGLYIDLDFQCLKPIAPLLQGWGVVLGRAKGETPNAFMASVPGHPFMLAMVKGLSLDISWVKKMGPVKATGPCLVARTLKDFRDDPTITIRPPADLYPLDYPQMKRHGGKFQPGDLSQVGDAFAVHWWFAQWQKIATMPEEDFEDHIVETKESGDLKKLSLVTVTS